MKRTIEALFGVAVGLWLLVTGARSERIGFASRSWPTADGVVVQSEIVQRKGPRVALRYEYSVSGTPYSNDVVGVATDVSLDRSGEARSVQSRYPLGSRVAVHYDPGAPGTSVLEPGGHGGLVFLAFGVGALVGIARRMRG